ncbi:Agrin [Halotydeus destructor]|nr:Agrin [Halotydeus destructor]
MMAATPAHEPKPAKPDSVERSQKRETSLPTLYLTFKPYKKVGSNLSFAPVTSNSLTMAKVLNLVAILCVLCSMMASIECRIRYKYRKRLECRDNWPRRVNDLPSVVLIGLVENVHGPSSIGPTAGSEDATYSASVYVKWVFKGSTILQDNRITVNGFGDSLLCHSQVTPLDSWIFFLDQLSSSSFKLNGTLHKVHLHNLDRINAITRDEPYRRRPEITELPCEGQYCENNGNCIQEQTAGIIVRPRCQCLDSCPHVYEPVCGSNGETFANQCRIRMDSCKRSQNFFVRHPGDCSAGHRTVYNFRHQITSVSQLAAYSN